MNTENCQSKSEIYSVGKCLRMAREYMGITQQDVAERLCLKVSIVRNIEEDKSPSDLAFTFLRGYIYSYARLVQVPQEDLLTIMEKYASVNINKIDCNQGITNVKNNKKFNKLLIVFTWFISFLALACTSVWWWHNHRSLQNTLIFNTDKNHHNINNVNLLLKNKSLSNTEYTDTNIIDQVYKSSFLHDKNYDLSKVRNISNSTVDRTPQSIALPPFTNSLTNLSFASIPEETNVIVKSNIIFIEFMAKCWIEVIDATRKKLFSGLQDKNRKIQLCGIAPYSLKIGVPSAVKVIYQNHPIDLSNFIHNKQVVRLTLGA